MAIKADLYLDTIDPARYLNPMDCQRCGSSSCRQWLEKIKAGKARLDDCASLDPALSRALKGILSLESILPQVEITQYPVPGLTGLYGINEPGPDSPVIVTGSAAITQEVVLTVLSTTDAPFHVLFVDTKGHTVDMAVIYRTFTPQAVLQAVEGCGLGSLVSHRDLIMPGLTAGLKEPIEAMSEWHCTIGPVCVGELPLFLGARWR